MLTLSFRLTAAAIITLITLIFAAQVAGRVLPAGQIVPIVPYGSATILLVDVNRRVAANRHVTANPNTLAVITDASVSPNQQQLVLTVSDEFSRDVYVSDLFSSTYHRLTTDRMGGEAAAWSPDSQQVAFIGLEPDNKRGIYSVAADGTSEPETIIRAGNYAYPAWSGKGDALTFAASRYRDLANLYVLDADCRLRCDREVLQVTDTLVIDTAPVWSPDGTQIAFLSDRGGDYEIYLLNTRCMQPGERKCTLQIPQRLRMRPLVVPFLIIWSLDGSEIFFRGREAFRNQPGLYSVKSNCYSLPEGCRPRLIYSLAHLTTSRLN